MTAEQIRRAMQAAGFTEVQCRDFLIAWDTDVALLTATQLELIEAFYFAAAWDLGDVLSQDFLAAVAEHAEILETAA